MKDLTYIFKSGKFKDKTVSEVCEINPDYILILHKARTCVLKFTEEVIAKCQTWQYNLK